MGIKVIGASQIILMLEAKKAAMVDQHLGLLETDRDYANYYFILDSLKLTGIMDYANYYFILINLPLPSPFLWFLFLPILYYIILFSLWL